MEFKASAPRDASSLILVKDHEIFLAQRNPEIAFLGGWHAFAGGKTEEEDAVFDVRNCENSDLTKFIATAVRETFEETGVLIVRNGEKLTKGQLVSLHDDLMSGRNTFAGILEDWGLWLDAGDFHYSGFWTTPPFSPVRFKTRFFAAICPPKQTPLIFGEFTDGGFIRADEALRRWERSEILISPPVLIALKELAKQYRIDENISSAEAARITAENLLEKSRKRDGNLDFIEFDPRITCIPLKTETLPPATHTNCFIVGKKKFAVIDPASPDPREHRKLFDLIDNLIAEGGICTEIVVSHYHPDHTGGEVELKKYLLEKHKQDVIISAHPKTFEALEHFAFNNYGKAIDEGFVLDLENDAGEWFDLQVIHTPGHARGHLAFYSAEFGFLLSSDNVVSTGSVLIARPEGNMTDYLESLERLRDLPNLRFLCGSHGLGIFNAKAKIGEYIAHRLERERLIIQSLDAGVTDLKEIVAAVYTDVAPSLYDLAELSVEAHLERIRETRG